MAAEGIEFVVSTEIGKDLPAKKLVKKISIRSFFAVELPSPETYQLRVEI